MLRQAASNGPLLASLPGISIIPPRVELAPSWSILSTGQADVDVVGDRDAIDWTEQDIVHLHWLLLKEVAELEDPATPLEEKLDTLGWIFTEREKDSVPFSFVNCLRVVGCSPLSPIAYCGLVDAEEIRLRIRRNVKAWLLATLERYPPWVQEAVMRNPEWVERHLAKNPQWINEQIRRYASEGDLFA
ncbi:MAG: hypothetical protein EKK45_14530 [Curvibacter sp.]|nr:MAG: hypothetical protein EKK45_14530 [Curvibacter sp.]